MPAPVRPAPITPAAAKAPRGGQHGPSPVDGMPSLAASLAQAEAAEQARRNPPPWERVPHLVVIARAGTGKTTTLVEGLKVVMGLTPAITPSGQQAAIWAELARGPRPRSVCFVAFNRSIADELRRRVPPGVDAKTMHGMGMAAVRKAFKLRDGDAGVNQYRVADLTAEHAGSDVRTLRKTKPEWLKAVTELVSLCKTSLVTPQPGDADGALAKLARHYGVEGAGLGGVADAVAAVYERCKDVAACGCIDYDDMVWLPVVLGLKVWQNDLLLVDEAQDLNRCQQALARMAGRRLVFCGDDAQAIYGFAGADSEALPRLTKSLQSDPRGCVVLPLTVTRRCGRAIVDAARAYVQDFQAHESNPVGEVRAALYPLRRTKNPDGSTTWEEVPEEKTYLPHVKDGDMVLCRANAPLVRECLRFVKRGRRAKIQGRDVGKTLIALVEKMDADTVPQLVGRLADWLKAETDKEMAERNPSENKLQALADRYDCVRAVADVASSVPDVVARLTALFTDDDGEPGIKLSSVHRAKGLEARTVFFIDGFGPPAHKLKDWELQQETNLRYVAVTRAISCLYIVS